MQDFWIKTVDLFTIKKRPKSSGNNPQCVCSSRTPAQFLCGDCPLRSVVFLLLGDMYISVLIPPHVSAILLETRDATVSTFPSTGRQKHLHHSDRRVTEKHDHMCWRTNCVLSVTRTPLLSHTHKCVQRETRDQEHITPTNNHKWSRKTNRSHNIQYTQK